jgi:acetyl-CoA decarbonylase/synthase complex subunit delta
MKDSPIKEDSDWGPAVYRGPLYEIMTGLTLGIAGGDMFMMMHPKAAVAVKKVTQLLFGAKGAEDKAKKVEIGDWVTWAGGTLKK